MRHRVGRIIPIALVALLIALLSSIAAPSSARAEEPGDTLSVSLLTMGPGEHPFTKFGHTAIWVHDAGSGRDEVFNFGTFAFDSPTLFLDSVQGKLPYWLSVQGLRGTLASYRAQHRSLLASELELTPAQSLALLTALRDNALPEHRYYRYDYYRDNCATRVRDALDRVLAGAIHAHGNTPASMSYRAHTLRLVADDPKLYVALDLAVGRATDAPITFWDEAFLPERLHDLLAATTVTRDGHALPLIALLDALLASELPPAHVTPPSWFGFYLGVGLCFGLALALLGREARANAHAKRALGTLAILLGVPLGMLGWALAYLTFFSAHSAAAANYNVLLIPPWTCLFPVAAIAGSRKRRWAPRLATLTAFGALVSTGCALVVHLVTRNAQANGQELALVLPLWLGAAFAAHSSQTRALPHRTPAELAPTATTRVTPKISG